MLRAAADSVLSLIYPQRCSVCGTCVESSANGVACSECWARTRVFGNGEQLCSKCGAYLSASSLSPGANCHKCTDHEYDSAAAVGVYEFALSASVIELKHTPHLPKRLREHLIDAFERSAFASSTLIVPVPLSPKRSFERGFNQADLIASGLSKASGIRADKHSLVRRIHTPVHRVGMDRKARELTVKNAFEVKRPRLISGQTILLVDDIFTSGATASYCAKVLKRNGADKVNVLTLARAV